MGHVACRNLPWHGLPPRETLSQDIDICFLRQREEDKSAGLLKMVATRKESLNKADLKNTCECFKVLFCNVRELKKEKVTRFSINLRDRRSKGKGRELGRCILWKVSPSTVNILKKVLNKLDCFK